MKVYVAAPYPRKDKARLACAVLHQQGLEPHCSWVKEPDHARSFEELTAGQCMEAAERDAREVRESDALLLLPGREGHGAKFVEAGIALALGKVVCAIGERENTLIHHPDIALFARVVDAAIHIKNR